MNAWQWVGVVLGLMIMVRLYVWRRDRSSGGGRRAIRFGPRGGNL